MASQIFSYILFFYFHLYIIHAYLSESSANISTSLKFLDELNRVQKENQREGVDKLKNYLAHLGYMTTCPRNFINNENKNTVDKCLELALKKYQKFYQLKITGVLDEATSKKMRQRRCGMPDFYPTKSHKTPFHEHYSFLTGTPLHSTNSISYAFKGVNEQYILAMELALRKWESVTRLKFTRSKSYYRAMIHINFKSKFSRDEANTLAMTLKTGDLVLFNGGMKWSHTNATDAYDIESVFLHEIGHALGLGHSEIEQASMYPNFIPGEVRGLHQDDINGIRALYHL